MCGWHFPSFKLVKIKDQTILLKDLFPLRAEHLTEDINFYQAFILQ